MMPLALADVGAENQYPQRWAVLRRSRSIWRIWALWPAATATVVASMSGNIIVKVKEARVAISEEMARKIMV